jgi:hypothetical protein
MLRGGVGRKIKTWVVGGAIFEWGSG